MTFVDYEAFGAVGDGERDDFRAICDAHAYANAHGLPVRTKPDATYYLGGGALTAHIETDVDWSTSRFTIDDRAVENNKLPCFLIRSPLPSEPIGLTRLARDQKHLGFAPGKAVYILVKNEKVKRFIRLGLNQNGGFPQTDCFLASADGAILSPIDWDYDEITEAVACPADERPLTISGGIFTTIANQGPSVYDYYSRGITINRSRTTVEGLTHYVTGELGHGSPYGGFLSAERCAGVTLSNCFFTGHKIYLTVGAAGKPVPMGSYDLNAASVVNLRIVGCESRHITDRSRWGVIGSNFCKNIVMEDCVISRIDAHMGVSGEYTVRNTEIGWQGINAIGRGLLTLDGVTSRSDHLLNFRDDYGSTWHGPVVIRDCVWTPRPDAGELLEVIQMQNNGMHDYGYPCSMPESVEVDGLSIADRHAARGSVLFCDPCDNRSGAMPAETPEKPHPYRPCARVSLRGVKTESGRPLRLSSNRSIFADTAATGLED